MHELARTTCRQKVAFAAWAAIWIAAAAGCGSSVYGEKFQNRLDELHLSSTFSEVLTDQPTDGLPINFRIPKGLTKAYNQISADSDNDNHRISRLKFAPAFLPDFPGLMTMFEGEADSTPEFKAPYYLYIGEGTESAVKGKFPYQEWRDRIQRSRMKPGAWEDVEAQTPKGAKLKWKRLTVTGKHVWEVTRRGSRTPENPSVDTFFQMWVYETPQTIAVLGWWSTNSMRPTMQQMAELTAGTAVVSPSAAVAPAPGATTSTSTPVKTTP
jgi:hypothetical protein